MYSAGRFLLPFSKIKGNFLILQHAPKLGLLVFEKGENTPENMTTGQMKITPKSS